MSNNNRVYSIKFDYGYGDWGFTEWGISESKTIEMFNMFTGHDFTTIKECLECEHLIYSVEEGYGEENKHWEDS